MKDETERWLDAGARLTRDPQARVPCPACHSASLAVQDVMGARAMERQMVCPACGARNWLFQTGVSRPR